MSFSPDMLPDRVIPLASEPSATEASVMEVEPLAVEEPSTTVKRSRLASLDVFRGLTIAMMVLVNNEGNEHQYAPLKHAAWHGWTPTDLVFPFFLFIVGVAIPFSLGKRGVLATRGELFGRIWVRALALFMVGAMLRAAFVPLPWINVPPDGFLFTKALRWFGFMFAYAGLFALLVPWRSRRLATWLPIGIAIVFVAYCLAMHFARARAIANGWPSADFGGSAFNPDMMRIPGVLQRIGICYGVAASIAALAGWRTVLFSAVALCVAYALLMFEVPVAGHRLGSLDLYDNFARTVDVRVFERWAVNAEGVPFLIQKHSYSEYPDNEGIVSTLPAIATALFGVLAGLWLRSPRGAADRCAGLLAAAGPVIFLGVVLDHALMPINKNLWTPSFAVFTAGMAMLVLGTIFWLCDVLGYRRWAWPFKVMGMNAIAAFAASSLILLASGYFPFFRLADGTKAGFLPYAKGHILDGLSGASRWLALHHPSLGATNINTLANQSLAYSLFFVLLVFVLMCVLYVCRIFVKV